MKIHSRCSLHPRDEQGFTLIELMTVIAIIAILASMTIGAFSYAQTMAGRSRTLTALTAIKNALEQYKEKYGEYPTPKDAKETSGQNDFGGQKFVVGGSKCLYQAITGDGTDALLLAQGAAATASDGQVDATEVPNSIVPNLPKNMVLLTSAGYCLVDGFSHPFQYAKGGIDQTSGSNAPLTVNPNYDLWSYAQAAQSANTATLATPTDRANVQPNAPANPWIRNWSN